MKNPEIRFIDDNIDWKPTKLGNIGTLKNGYSFKSNLYVKDSIFNVLTISNVQGNRYIIINEDTNKYPYIPNDISTHQVLKENDILVSLTGNVGRVSLNQGKNNLLNQRVGLFDIQDKSIDKLYIFELMHSKKFENTMILQGQGAAQLNISKGDIEGYEVKIPTISVQKEISSLLSDIDQKISSQEILIKKLKDTKSALLIKMFPQENQSVPELRFDGFTDTWEQRKFKELVDIERGGSPRPIDAYITTEKDGLNWIKIGDAPTYGNYITHTAEKIKPSGLSRTREVHPGDLILSNSMSFGKPYIMAINGCIHDGWLLIRNTYNIFDLKFLCTLLGTQQMINQYKSLAAGSTVNNLSKELVGNTNISLPDIEEQKLIGTLFYNLDNTITLHQRKSFHLNFSL